MKLFNSLIFEYFNKLFINSLSNPLDVFDTLLNILFNFLTNSLSLEIKTKSIFGRDNEYANIFSIITGLLFICLSKDIYGFFSSFSSFSIDRN